MIIRMSLQELQALKVMCKQASRLSDALEDPVTRTGQARLAMFETMAQLNTECLGLIIDGLEQEEKDGDSTN